MEMAPEMTWKLIMEAIMRRIPKHRKKNAQAHLKKKKVVAGVVTRKKRVFFKQSLQS
jgi:transposase